MNPNQGWQQRYGYAYNYHQRQGAPPDVPPPAATPIDAVHDAQALLAVYPMASVTPTNHVARHLSSMTLTAPPPTFVQPSYYAVHGSAYAATSPPPPPPPPYTEYAQEPHYAASQNIQNGYWNSRADEAVRLLNPPSSTRSPYHYQQPTHWTPPPPMQTSSFQTHPFAQAIFQRTAPASAYPTPPPPGITSSSSSLAHALGPMPPPPRSSSSPPKQPKVYRPEESAVFFDNFLEQKSREMVAAKASLLPPLSQPTAPALPPPRATTPPRPPVQKTKPPPKPQIEESPDPLALRSNATTPSTPVAVTPKKRKVYVQLESPSVKRLQSMKSMYITPDKSKALPVVSGGVGAAATPTTPVPLTPSTTNTPSTTSMGKLSRSGKHIANVHDTPDLGGYGSEEDDVYSPVRASRFDSVRSSARRTGDRDERAPLEKLTSLIEDVFEAEDSLPPELDSSDLPDFFSPLTLTDPSRPLLHPNIIRKLTKYIGHVARPSKRLRHGTAGVQGTPKGKGRMAEVETQMLSRLLKILERNVKAGEDIDPFSSTNAALLRASPSKKSPKKPSKAVKKGAGDLRSRSRTPADEDAEGDLAAEMREPVEVDHEKLTGLLDIARDSVLAADCCIALLASDRLAKQLYSEELITSCLNTIKSQLTKIIYPFVETSVELQGQSASALASIDPALLLLVRSPSGDPQEAHRRQLSEIFQAVSSVIPRINGIIGAESVAMSDSIIIQAVYIAIGPFFVVDGGDGEHSSGAGSKGKKENVVLRTFGRSAMRGLRLDALSLIRSIFANHEDQRSWIIEEILSSLIKLSDTKQKAGQFRLRDGRSIRTVSALLLQLVQTSAHDVRIEAKRIDKARQQRFALRRQESMTESQTNLASPEPLLDEHDLEEIRLYGAGLDSATKAAKTIILFLTQRSGKGKATKNSNEAEYRTIFDNLISDLLAVLYWPEWPAASLLLSVACKYMVSSLDDIKSSSQNDTNAAKTMALDHLGVVAAKIRSSAIHVQQEAVGKLKYRALKSLDEIVTGVNVKEFDKLLSAHKDVICHLCKRSSEDQAYDSARELTAAILGYDLAQALKQVHMWISDPDADEDLNLKDKSKLPPFGQKLKAALRDVWKDPSSDVFDIGSQEEVARIDRLAEEIGTVQSLRNSFHPILNIILAALDAPAIFMRTKALRALGQIVTSDATILAAANVRRAIESHLLDSSPAVRDAAVELIGKYMIDSPEVAGDYYQKIADRMADTGLSVRKRVIKLLKAFYSVTQDNARRIDISTRLILRLLDEDDSVKDLAIRTIEELWFPSSLEQSSTAKTRSGEGTSVYRDKESLLSKVVVIMETAANFKDRQSPLEDILHKIMVDKEGHDATALHARYTEICETLIDGLVDASDLPGFTIINCIRTIYLFTSAYPPVLSGANASTLLPYLKNATTSEEQATSDYLLKVFRASVPHMPKTAAKFGHELQMTLQPMIIKPNGGSVQVLQESVACMCIVIQNLTHDFTRLVNLLKSCNIRLQQSIRRPHTDGMNANDFKALSILIFIVALLGENCSFDALRRDHEELVSDINSISQGPIIEHIYYTLLKLYEKYDNATLRGRILQCLGFLFRAQPTLMIMESSATIMDAIFASPEEEARGRLLKIMQDFLTSEAAKNASKEKEAGKGKTTKQSEVNMEELVGNTDGFADSGVSSAIVQRYLNHILDAALSQNPHIQSIAVDVLSFTIKQGLAHPLQSFPVLVALETSPISTLANRVNALHSILHGKHASLLNTRYTISARASFDYQKKVIQGVVRGFRAQPAPIALLQRWYSLVREKRPARQDFLKALVKVFQDGSSQQATQDDVDFIRYMAENFASFDYKTQEEVITVIKHLTMVLSTSGTQLLEIISPSHLLAQLHAPSSQSGQENHPGQEHVDATSETIMTDKVPLLRSSVIIAMVMLLKAHLKTLYSLSEDKCNRFVLGKKSAVGDRPAIRKHEKPISWDRLPYAMSPILTTDDVEAQKVRFLEIWNEDGVAAEPEDDFA